MEFQEVDLSAVTFMLAEAIIGKIGTEVTHHSVTGNFSNHTGSGDAEAKAIAIDNSSLGNWKGNNGQAINQHVVGRAGERCNGVAHRSMSGAQNIDSVDLHRIDNADRPTEVGARDQVAINFFAYVRRKLFRIVQAPVTEFFRKNDGGGYNRTGQGTTASLVDPSDASGANGAEFLLVAKSTAPIHAAANLMQLQCAGKVNCDQ
jgi:hypothetical protein